MFYVWFLAFLQGSYFYPTPSLPYKRFCISRTIFIETHDSYCNKPFTCGSHLEHSVIFPVLIIKRDKRT